MQTSSALDYPALPGLNHIDALIGIGPDWNLLASAGNTIKYTFSITSGTQPGETGLVAFNSYQQSMVRHVLTTYISSLTGIQFVETGNGVETQVHFCYQDLEHASGLCYSVLSYDTDPLTGAVLNYSAESFIYFDNVEDIYENSNFIGRGHETLLHELGHMLGLKHPFQAQEGNPAVFPGHFDSSVNSLMSYNEVGGPYRAFRPADIAALNWLYGRDGLGGAYGLGSATGGRYVTGSAEADVLRASAAADMLDGAEGADTVVFSGAWADYAFNELPNGELGVAGPDGADIFRSVELFQFSDGVFARDKIRDLTAPAAPVVYDFVNATGYAYSKQLNISGTAELGSHVRIMIDGVEAGPVAPNEGKRWFFQKTVAEGAHTISFSAVDGVGNASAAVAQRTFKLDSIAPLAPTASITVTPGENRPLASGTGEPGSTVFLNWMGMVKVAADGTWAIRLDPLPSQSYDELLFSTDVTNNMSFGAARLQFDIATTLDRRGTWNNDVLQGDAGDNAIEGLGGTDTVRYEGARADYSVTRERIRITVDSLADGRDSLLQVERVQFSDVTLAFDTAEGEAAGRAYRLYRAASDRVPDKEGLGFWIAAMEQPLDYLQLEGGFVNSAEFTALYGKDSSNYHFVSKLYEHVLHRGPDGAGFDYWVDALDKGTQREFVLQRFSESSENIAQVIGTIQHGMEYVPYG